MSGIAFVFPGQGSQHAGMGADLLEDPELADLAARCSEAAGVDLPRLLREAGDEELTLTTNAQPALLFAGVALALLCARRGVVPAAAAGHSVGEYTALCVAGAMSAEDAVRVVALRGRAMAEAAPPGTSSMLAVLGIGRGEVEAALRGIPDVWPANFNTPTQTVVGGLTGSLEAAGAALLEAGARRVLPLNVAAAFHTPLMSGAAARLREGLDAVAWAEPGIPVFANVDARPYSGAGAIARSLERQLSSPVLWADCVGRLREAGCGTFYELGPKRALSGMMRELAPDTVAAPVSSPEAVQRLQ